MVELIEKPNISVKKIGEYTIDLLIDSYDKNRYGHISRKFENLFKETNIWFFVAYPIIIKREFLLVQIIYELLNNKSTKLIMTNQFVVNEKFLPLNEKGIVSPDDRKLASQKLLIRSTEILNTIHIIDLFEMFEKFTSLTLDIGKIIGRQDLQKQIKKLLTV